ncbi:MAG: ABC transporter permease subunit [Cellvibrionales bacterium]|nr:ABC transporter permease subunit [Cellvibrionales bacterium]
MTANHNIQQAVDFNSPKVARYNHWRKIKDSIAKYLIAVGGIGVIGAILLIFLYLLYEVVPLFQSAKIKPLAEYQLQSEQRSIYLAVEEQNELALRLLPDGRVEYVNIDSGKPAYELALPVPDGSQITSFALNSDESRMFAVGLDTGGVLIAKHNYKITYPDDKRLITPELEFPYGEDVIEIADAAILNLGLRDSEEALTLVAATQQGLIGKQLVKEEDFIMETVEIVQEDLSLPNLTIAQGFIPKHLLLDVDGRFLFVQTSEDTFASINLHSQTAVYEKQSAPIADMQMLLGDISLLVALNTGRVSQWFAVRGNDQIQIKEIRDFKGDLSAPAKGIELTSEQRRKGFASITESGDLTLFHATAQTDVLNAKLLEKGTVDQMALSPRADRIVIETNDGRLLVFDVKNKHPEVSFYSLWQKVWYESYDEPKYVWQSSASSNDFEPKMSLTPLSFGTLKAAFYAMILAAPLAILGAIYTAYFMTPVMRRKIKPLIELMEALPTVILGFLAGLWLAPFMEDHLAAIFSILLVLPFGVILFGFLMSRLPMRLQNTISQGWHGFLLIPVILLLISFCIMISPLLEQWFFNGNMRLWLSNDLGIPFDQRNAMVVGLAMGFAVIPTIFSIAEDAIFSVPKHLSYGSLALGATPWQTMVGVVLPTASPGIFSGLMIGLGRAVGETMIVLMATGNTPIMDLNIFEGMRTLAANLAVEVPEAEVDSTHYRILFLAAFVLFLFTFVVNTLAEVVRQNLRKKYGSL